MKALPANHADLVAATAAGQAFDYVFFWGHKPSADGATSKSCFSQWWEAAFRVGDEVFPTAEHYMMARKARLFGDEDSARRILAAGSPNDAKSLGRKVKGFSEEVWLQHREEIVFTGNLAKFSQQPALRRFLIATGESILVEASPVDRIWGIGMAASDSRAGNPAQWQGLNLLGFALVKVRAHLALA